MRRQGIFLIAACAATGIAVPVVIRSTPGWNPDHSAFRLPNGWRLTPHGDSVALPGDMPVEMRFSDDGQSVYVVTAGYHDHSVSKIDLADFQVVKSQTFPNLWAGLVQPGPDELWVSAGKPAQDGDPIFKLNASDLSKRGVVPNPTTVATPFVAGMIKGSDGNVYALNIQTDQIVAYDKDGHFLESAGTSYRPFRIAEMPDKKTLAVANWGDATVSFFREFDLRQVGQVSVGPHPAAMAVDADGRLFVAIAEDRKVVCVENSKVTGEFKTGVNLPQNVGSTPIALALDQAKQVLYVANAGDNCVTVVDVSNKNKPVVKGLIPTGRYPSEMLLTPDGRTLLVATAKSFYGANATPETKNVQPGKAQPFTYIGNQLEGRVYRIPVPAGAELAKLTKQAQDNVLHPATGLTTGQESDARAALRNIKHVIYVIRENRTYDQVFGDLPQGNGDPSIVFFGRKVTPNGHALADEFTLLDNLYTDGEVSQCGHQWTDSAYANDYTEKQWILSYGDHGEVDSDARLTCNPQYIWEDAREHGLTAKVYAEYVNLQEDHDAASPAIKNRLAQMGYSDEVESIFAANGRDPKKVEVLLAEMRAAEQTGAWPSFMVIALPEDHTRGFRAGALSPFAMVGSNDQALGMLVEGVSHSKFWPSTAIFVIEDDAQNGPDHVDSHRTEGFFISPYVKRHAVDGTHYTTSSMLRTMEIILNLPPMTEYDATATPLLACVSSTPDLTPYDLLPPGVDLNEKNPQKGQLAELSKRLKFEAVDENDPDLFNKVLWMGLRPGQPYPR